MKAGEISRMINGISFAEAMAIIDKKDKLGNPYPFDISFRTLQRNSKTGGRLITYNQVIKSTSKKFIENKNSLLAAVQSGAIVKRNPNHYRNRTRLLELQNGDKKKIHIRLIVSINGQKMYY